MLLSESTVALHSQLEQILIAEANTIMQVRMSTTRLLLTAKAQMNHSAPVIQKEEQ